MSVVTMPLSFRMTTMVRLLVLALLAPTAVIVVEAERDCFRGTRLIPSGTSIHTSDCERHTCRDGGIMREFCSPIPLGCTRIPPQMDQPYPGCCPTWCCGKHNCGKGADIIFGPIADFKGGCTNGDQLVANGATVFTGSCEKITCTDGVLKTSRCSPVPPGCTTLKADPAQPYPACCPSYCCGEHCAEGNLLEPGHCTTGPYVIPNGGHLQTMECNRLSCKDGTLFQNLCFPIPPQCKTIPGEAGMPFPLCCDRRENDCVSTFVDRKGKQLDDYGEEVTNKERVSKRRMWFSAAVECNPETETCRSVKPVIITPDMTTPKPVYPEDAFTKSPMVVKPGDFTMAPNEEDEETPVIVHADNAAKGPDDNFEDLKELFM